MESISIHIAKHVRDFHFGGNWATTNLKDQLEDVTWQEATTQVFSFNTIATLVYHINYYVKAVKKVLEGEILNAKDKLSFNHPPIQSEEDWQLFLKEAWEDAEAFSNAIEQLQDDRLLNIFIEDKYGNYFRNLHGIIEHSHYHLGQISIIKKIIQQKTNREI